MVKWFKAEIAPRLSLLCSVCRTAAQQPFEFCCNIWSEVIRFICVSGWMAGKIRQRQLHSSGMTKSSVPDPWRRHSFTDPVSRHPPLPQNKSSLTSQTRSESPALTESMRVPPSHVWAVTFLIASYSNTTNIIHMNRLAGRRWSRCRGLGEPEQRWEIDSWGEGI